VPATAALSPALELTLDLFEPGRRPSKPDVRGGYLDLLGGEDPTGKHPGQKLMVSSALPLVYERLWRPIGGRLFMGAMVPRMADERKMALEMLDLGPGDRVLDVACGPGNFTRRFAEAAPEGLVVGIDASATMLARAVDEGAPPEVAYVRGDAENLPFADETFDAVCCFAALYLIEEPLAAIDEIVRVLAPGGRVALLSSVNRGLVPAGVTNAVVRRLSGIRVFGREELTRALHDRGLKRVKRRVAGFAQFVSGVAPDA
jgi:ubiquinone/menaquinone biosynthesis C-methylase UbiE